MKGFNGLLQEAMFIRLFSRSWWAKQDRSFRPLVAAVLSLRNAASLPKAARRELYERLACVSRAELLSEILEVRVPARVIPALERTVWREFEGPDWQLFFLILLEDPDWLALTHVPTITPTLLHQYALIPRELRRPTLLTVLSNLMVPADRWQKLRADLAAAPKDRRIGLIGR